MSWRARSWTRIAAMLMGPVALVSVLGVVSAAWADFTVCSTGCDLSNLINTNRTWAAATYWVWEHIQVQKKATLTLEPGVTLRFIPGTRLQVAGTLIAKGIEGRLITFTSGQPHAPPAPGDWGAIFFTKTAIGASFDKVGNYTGGSILEHCVVEYTGGGTAQRAIVAKSPRAPFVYQSTVRYNKAMESSSRAPRRPGSAKIPSRKMATQGSFISKCTATISGNPSISGNGSSGIKISGKATIQENRIEDNTKVGIYVDNIYGTQNPKVTLTRNDIVGNTPWQLRNETDGPHHLDARNNW